MTAAVQSSRRRHMFPASMTSALVHSRTQQRLISALEGLFVKQFLIVNYCSA